MKRWVFLTVVSLALLLLTLGCGAASTTPAPTTKPAANPPAASPTQAPAAQSAAKPAEAGKQITMKFGHGADPENPRHLGAVKFADLVKAKSNGRMVVEVYHSASLGSDEQMIEQLRSGVSHFAAPGSGSVAPLETKLSILDMPFRFKDFEQAWKILDGPVGQELASSLPQKDLRILGYWENGFRNMTNSKRPINTPEDLKGLKMRVPNWEVSVAAFKALGAQVTPLAWPEVYMALQQGVVDGQENPYANTAGAKLYEVQKYLSITRHQYSPLTLLVSEKFWKGLSADEQKILQEATKEAGTYQRNLVKDSEDKLLADLKAKGMQANTPPDMKPFQERVTTVYSDYKPKMGDILQKLLDATN